MKLGGDGDVPHFGVGRARRIQVPNVNLQHNVMTEAVENHMLEIVIFDEIGTKLETLVAGAISQRGVQLVGTGHGMTIDSLIKILSFRSLFGGIEFLPCIICCHFTMESITMFANLASRCVCAESSERHSMTECVKGQQLLLSTNTKCSGAKLKSALELMDVKDLTLAHVKRFIANSS